MKDGVYNLKAFKILTFVIAVLALILLSAPQSKAQTTSNAAAVSMTFAVNSSMTVTATPGSIVFTSTDSRACHGFRSNRGGNQLEPCGGRRKRIHGRLLRKHYRCFDGRHPEYSQPAMCLHRSTAVPPLACTMANVNVAAGNPGAICPQIFGGIGVTAQGTHSDNLLLSLTSPTAFRRIRWRLCRHHHHQRSGHVNF